MDKRLLIIGAGVEQIKAYELAREMGMRTVGTDMNPDAPAFKFADDRILASTRNAEETLRAVHAFVARKKIDGVMTIANDVPLTVATVACSLGLPSISLDSARVASNKMLMKSRFRDSGVSTPDYWTVTSLAELQRITIEQGYPLVIKPIDGRGARGVFRLTDRTDLNRVFNESVGHTQTGILLVERFVDGVQLSTESIIYKGKIYTASYTRRNYEYLDVLAPYVIENGGDQPADLTGDQKTSIDAVLMDAARAMGISEGVVKGDAVLENGKPMIIELAARLSGGYFSTDQIPLATGVDLVKQVIKLALGDTLDTRELVPQSRKAVAIRYWFPQSGVIKEIKGIDELKSMPGIYRYELFRKKGDLQPMITDHTKRAGFVIAYAGTRIEAVQRANEAITTVEFRVDDKLGND